MVGGKGAIGKKKILSASELGLKAESLGIAKTAKTHKGRKIMESRQPQVVENTKKSVFIRGNKMS